MPATELEPTRPRMLVVANRLPLAWTSTTGWQRAPGGLVTALDSFVPRHPSVWIGSSASLGDPDVATPTWPHGSLRQVAITPALANAAVDGMANSCLWPALHGMTRSVKWRDEWWRAYQDHNERFARTVAEVAASGDLVWIHDHQLLLVAEFLAVERPDLTVGLSIHTPFDANTIAALPVADALARALEVPALIGVQTVGDHAELARFCRTRRNDTVVSPVSIDPASLTALSRERATQVLVERLRARVASRRLIVGVDRIDSTKAIPQRIEAIDRAFRSGIIHPDEVEIVQIAQPSRTSLTVSRELRLQIERRAHDVASNWLRSDGTAALRVSTEGCDRRQVAALLTAADMALVTPRRDGMNLVAKEFSILNEPRSGALVLARGAGAADDLGAGSVLVDGDDPASVVDGIAQAFALDVATRREMARRRADTVRSWTSEHWAADFERRLLDAQVC